MNISPAIVVSSGRCGSTMLSDILNSHPDILSISELLILQGRALFHFRRLSGNEMWNIISKQTRAQRQQLDRHSDALLYPVGTPRGRYSGTEIPPISWVTLPHITDRPDDLLDELEPLIRSQPRQYAADHYRVMFSWLCRKFDRKLWVERSGGAGMYVQRLAKMFPEAKFIHLYRDGRDTVVSMRKHPVFREAVRYIVTMRGYGVDSLKPMTGASANAFRDWAALRSQLLIYIVFLFNRAKERELLLAEFAKFWSDVVDMADRFLDTLPPEKVLRVRFEDIQKEPQKEIARLVRFLDPSLDDPEWVNRAARIPRPTRSKLGDLAPAERAALTESCRGSLERLGYDVREE